MSDSSTTNDLQVPYFPATAIVNIQLGSLIIQQLQGVVAFLIEGHTQAEFEGIADKVNKKEPLLPWEQSCITITTLLNGIMTAAKDQGLLEMRSLSQSLQGLV